MLNVITAKRFPKVKEKMNYCMDLYFQALILSACQSAGEEER